MRGALLSISILLIFACAKDDGGTHPDASTDAGSGSGAATDPASSTGGSGSGSGSGSGGDSGQTSGPATSSASGGSGGSDGSDPGGGPACQQAEDCALFSDCCECKAVLTSDNPPSCFAECEQTLCESWGAGGASCLDGECVLAPINCDDSRVICRVAIPECPDGFNPVVTPDGTCWTGQCAPAEHCG